MEAYTYIMTEHVQIVQFMSLTELEARMGRGLLTCVLYVHYGGHAVDMLDHEDPPPTTPPHPSRQYLICEADYTEVADSVHFRKSA